MTHIVDKILESIEFVPVFYIMDEGRCRMMVVEKDDKYEYSGIWITNYYIENGTYIRTESYPATLGKSSLQEYVRNYGFTKSKEDACSWLQDKSYVVPISTEQMQHMNSNPDFKY